MLSSRAARSGWTGKAETQLRIFLSWDKWGKDLRKKKEVLRNGSQIHSSYIVNVHSRREVVCLLMRSLYLKMAIEHRFSPAHWLVGRLITDSNPLHSFQSHAFNDYSLMFQSYSTSHSHLSTKAVGAEIKQTLSCAGLHHSCYMPYIYIIRTGWATQKHHPLKCWGFLAYLFLTHHKYLYIKGSSVILKIQDDLA